MQEGWDACVVIVVFFHECVDTNMQRAEALCVFLYCSLPSCLVMSFYLPLSFFCDRMSGHCVPRIQLFPSTNDVVTEAVSHTWSVIWVHKFMLKSSCSHSKHSYTSRHLPRPHYSLLWNIFNPIVHFDYLEIVKGLRLPHWTHKEIPFSSSFFSSLYYGKYGHKSYINNFKETTTKTSIFLIIRDVKKEFDVFWGFGRWSVSKC